MQKINSSNPNSQQLSQLEAELRKKMGEAMVSIVSHKSELHLAMNEKINQSIAQIDSEFKRKLQEQQANLNSFKSEIL